MTMENPKNSYFWWTKWVKHLLQSASTFCADFQVCMMGGSRDKWTRVLANFQEIAAMSVSCDQSHCHAPWGFAKDETGRQVWATSLESQYPKKMCVVLTFIILQVAEHRGLKRKQWIYLRMLKVNWLWRQRHKVIRRCNQGPLRSLQLFLTWQFSLLTMSHLCRVRSCQRFTSLFDSIQNQVFFRVPANSRLLRFSATPELDQGGVLEAHGDTGDSAKRRKVSKVHQFKVAFGLPWSWENFVKKAVNSEHSFLKGIGVPFKLQKAIEKHVEWSTGQLCKFRLDWCKRWLVRARDLDQQELQSNEGRPSYVAAVTKGKRLLLTREILEELQYDDMGALSLLDERLLWLVRWSRPMYFRLSSNLG